MDNNYYCIHCGSVVKFEYKQKTTICPDCQREIAHEDAMPGWTREARINQLKAMHNMMCEANDENIYMAWIAYGMPDCPQEYDFIDMALDDEAYNETFDLFVELIQKKGNRW